MKIEDMKIDGIKYISTEVRLQAMQSEEDARKIISAFETAILQGYYPGAVEHEIYNQLNIDPDSLMWYDKDRILRKVNEIWASHNSDGFDHYA